MATLRLWTIPCCDGSLQKFATYIASPQATSSSEPCHYFFCFGPGRVLHITPWGLSVDTLVPGEKKAHKHKLFALANVQMALGQTTGCPRVNRAKKFMCSPQNTGNKSFSLWLTGGLSQGCPEIQKVDVFKVYGPFSCPISGPNHTMPPRCAMQFESNTPKSLAMGKSSLH